MIHDKDLYPVPPHMLGSVNIISERELRYEEEYKGYCEYGISFLNDALINIGFGDLIVLGAATGIGKTELATNIALHNCMLGKKVRYFALEAEDKEIERRIKYRKIAKYYYHDPKVFPYAHVNYAAFRKNKLNNFLENTGLERKVETEMQAPLSNLVTYYRGEEFSIANLESAMIDIEDKHAPCDLIIIDHLHYFDQLNLDDPENKHLTIVMKHIRKFNSVYKIPIILISHLRKSQDRRTALPNIDDFMGSSNITKIATQCILISPNYTNYRNGYLYNTLFQIVKNRLMRLDQYIANVPYDIRRNQYCTEYTLHMHNKKTDELMDIFDNDMPDWAKSRQMLSGSTQIKGDDDNDPI